MMMILVMLLEKKVYETYLEAMVELRNNLIRALCLNLEPSFVYFCQQTMRHEHNEFIDRDFKEF